MSAITILGNSAKSVDRGHGDAVSGAVSGAVRPCDLTRLDAAATIERLGEVERRQVSRRNRFTLQRVAQRLLPGTRVARCMCGLKSGAGWVSVVEGDGYCSYRGVETCSSVWLCPVCSRRISEVRRGELNQLLVWAREQGYAPVMMTLTMRHSAEESLAQVLERLKAAKKVFHQSRAWREYSRTVRGHVTATEVTYGSNGWHPHLHCILIIDAKGDQRSIILLGQWLREAWSDALISVGGSGNGHAFGWHGADFAGEYVTKWGAASEMVMSTSKRAYSGVTLSSRNPWQLLKDAGDGDYQAREAWLEYATVFPGRRQLVWSRGLKLACGLDDVSDAEICDAEDGPVDAVEIVRIPAPVWARVVALGVQADVLTVCEQRSSIDEVWQYLHEIGDIGYGRS